MTGEYAPAIRLGAGDGWFPFTDTRLKDGAELTRLSVCGFHARPDPNAAFQSSSQPPSKWCCDDRLNSPGSPQCHPRLSSVRPGCVDR